MINMLVYQYFYSIYCPTSGIQTYYQHVSCPLSPKYVGLGYIHYFSTVFWHDFSAWYFGMEFLLQFVAWKNVPKPSAWFFLVGPLYMKGKFQYQNQYQYFESPDFKGNFLAYIRTMNTCPLSPKYVGLWYRFIIFELNFGAIFRHGILTWKFGLKFCLGKTVPKLLAWNFGKSSSQAWLWLLSKST